MTDQRGQAARAGGHRSMPHTADLRIEAWAPTREECISQTVHGMVDGFAELPPDLPRVERECVLTADTGDRLLVAVLEEVIYRQETSGELPVAVAVTPTDGGALVRFTMVDSARAEQVGAVPKAVALHGLRLAHGPDGWACGVTLDV
jgi:SHS2 domain-containing protein